MANHIKEITHAAEDLLDAYRNNKIEYSEEIVETLYDAFDEVIELIDAIEESGTVDIQVDEKEIKEIQESIRSLLSSQQESKEDSC